MIRHIFKAKDGKVFAGSGPWGKLLAQAARDRYDRQSSKRQRQRRGQFLASTIHGWELRTYRK